MKPQPLPLGLTVLRRLPLPRRLGLLERLFGASLARRGVAWVETASGIPWKLDLSDPTQRWIAYGDYEGAAQMNWCRHRLAGGGVFVDSGASIGQMLLHLAPLPGVRVIAFEPVPDSLQWLRECLALQPDWQVVTECAALSDTGGTLDMQVAGPHSTLRMDWYAGQEYPRIRVPALRLDQYASDHGIEHIRLWKLDMEGAEDAALEGAAGLLSAERIDAFLVEVSTESFGPIARRLGGFGHLPARIDRAGRLIRDPQPVKATCNRVFCRT